MKTCKNSKDIEVALYILEKTKGVDLYHLLKIMYFADRAHLAEWGCRITDDNYCAITYGPVPTELYDAIKQGKLKDCIGHANDDASNFLLAKRSPDLNYLSTSNIEALDHSISENVNLSFNELYHKSHDSAYKEAAGKRPNVLANSSMALAAGASEGMAEYIIEQMAIESALR